VFVVDVVEIFKFEIPMILLPPLDFAKSLIAFEEPVLIVPPCLDFSIEIK